MKHRNKKIVFTTLTALLPIAFFILFEGFLRLFGLFRQEPFIIKISQYGREYYQLNPWVAKRYFDPGKVTVPGLQPDKFLKDKEAQTFRIFCLGGSTTAGFPFDCQVPFPAQLRYLLSQAYPHYRFEVINTGISAINSFSVLDLLPEILAHAPDVIIIYMGHNEFYGAYGSASTIALGQNDGFIRFYLKLQKLHIVQMLQRFISQVSSSQNPATSHQDLMTAVIKDQSISYGSEKYHKTLQSFRNNLDRILGMCAKKNVPVILSNLVSNVRDLPPFASRSPEFTNSQAQQIYKQALALGDSLFERQRYAESVTAYRVALAQDSSAAQLWYKLGLASAALQDSAAAAYYFYGAKDRDLIPFRASEQINDLIAAAATRYQARFVDMKAVFTQRSPQGLIGNNIMVDHLHPDPNGHYLMATTFYQALRATGLLKNPDENFEPAVTPYFVTDLDWDIGLLKIFQMTHHWPFPEKPVKLDDYKPYGDPTATAIAKVYLLEDNVWSRAHYKMAEAYLQRKEYERARREYLAVSVFAPDDPYPYQMVAKTYEIEGAWDKRELFLKKALPFSNQKGMLLYQIAIAQWQQKNLAAACESMSRAINYPDLNRAQKQNARFYLAGFYADAHDFATARQILIALLQEDPTFQPARIFLQKLGLEQH
ncbi:MAG: GDSL-type esterase/lipase family protein [candidate division KSB1 bacterium]|nr:GDSL-type esterase/lipase family protein [candidate division KSB1 bacterium]MDZ7301876.1 GDSL-type esterase/lipase family protein [candidate division KSB1 bacterium]MDZ7310259.1 GDSL-type esterase/lipase family protein [candidate division KSB1 bacterium]